MFINNHFETKPDQTKQNKTKQNKTKQKPNKTKQKQNIRKLTIESAPPPEAAINSDVDKGPVGQDRPLLGAEPAVRDY